MIVHIVIAVCVLCEHIHVACVIAEQLVELLSAHLSDGEEPAGAFVAACFGGFRFRNAEQLPVFGCLRDGHGNPAVELRPDLHPDALRFKFTPDLGRIGHRNGTDHGRFRIGKGVLRLRLERQQGEGDGFKTPQFPQLVIEAHGFGVYFSGPDRRVVIDVIAGGSLRLGGIRQNADVAVGLVLHIDVDLRTEPVAVVLFTHDDPERVIVDDDCAERGNVRLHNRFAGQNDDGIGAVVGPGILVFRHGEAEFHFAEGIHIRSRKDRIIVAQGEPVIAVCGHHNGIQITGTGGAVLFLGELDQKHTGHNAVNGTVGDAKVRVIAA